MKKMFLPGLMLFFASVLRAQFYAPETDFHDHCQRTFPVEAARVLAWQQNAAGAAIAEVTYQLETQNEDTVWHIQWLDEHQKPLREKTVRYAPSLLVGGPKFFREVFHQLAGEDWLPKRAQPGNVDAPFWEGAALAGVSRLEALAAANRQIARTPRVETAADAARLAGILAHGAVPLSGNSLTLDSLYLSRAAAWLCLAEQLAETPDDTAWAPILFLSQRERFARDIWQGTVHPGDAGRGDAGRFWDLVLRMPSTKDCFVFAAQKNNRQFAVPAMLYPAQFDPAWMDLLVEVVDKVVGEEMVPRLFEYGPHVSIRGQAGGGGQWGARMPGIAMGTWLAAMAAFQPPPHDFTGYRAALKEAAASAEAAGGDAVEAVKALAPVINLGLDEGSGPLIPVATVTARDLLGYGWEMAGLQFGYSHDFLAAAPQGAVGLTRAVLDQVKGVDVFFRNTKIKPRFPLDDLRRLQFVGSSLVETALLRKLPDDWRSPADRYLSRRWLVRGGNSGIEAFIRNGGRAEDVRIFIERMRHEGGPLAVCNLVNHDADTKFPSFVDVLGMRDALLADMPWHYQERIRVADKPGKARAFASARNLEQLGWEALAFPDHYLIFSNYVTGNAEESARRFYDEARPFFVKRPDFAFSTGPARYALAWIDGDEATERRVLEDCSGRSETDLRLQFIHAVLHGRYDEALQKLDAALGYDASGGNKAMKEYLPRIPALLDEKHVDHVRAVATFPKGKDWLFLRWALARQAALPTEEIVHLFHHETDGPEGIFAAAAWGDKEHFDPFRALYVKVALDPMEQILITHEFVRQQGTKPQKNQSDLKPAGARPIKELVDEELRRQAAP